MKSNLNSSIIKTLREPIVLVAILLCTVSTPSIAQVESDPYPDYLEEVFMDMDFDPNLATPAVPKSAQSAISAYQTKKARSLRNKAIVDLMRNDDVIVVTIPTDNVFLPNDTLLNKDSERALNVIVPLMKDPYMYKVLVAVHTDDTGSELYRKNLSMSRLNSIYDWILDQIDLGKIPVELVVIPFSMGSDEPLVINDTRKHRQENRRLEFFFIPGPKMIELAQKNKLK